MEVIERYFGTRQGYSKGDFSIPLIFATCEMVYSASVQDWIFAYAAYNVL